MIYNMAGGFKRGYGGCMRLTGFFISLISVVLFFSRCSIVIPPVTITGEKTAIEKQIIGEQGELEDDIWMIASAQTAQNVEQTQTGEAAEIAEKEVPRDTAMMYDALIIQDAYSERLTELKKDGVVGETNQGLIANLFKEEGVSLSTAMQQKYNPELEEELDEGLPYRNLIATVSEMNKARNMVIDAYILQRQRTAPNTKTDRSALVGQQTRRYQGAALSGEYIQQANGSWVKK